MFARRALGVMLVVCSLLLQGVVSGEESRYSTSVKSADNSGKGANPANSLGSSEVSVFTGSFTHTIPLAVPPGTNGLQPILKLIYNSSKSNGWCGIGWDLSFGVIQRATKNGIPTYDTSDIFVFSSGGNSEELVPIGNNEYRVKIDSSFMVFKHIQVTVGGQPRDYWTANDKYGNVYLFGQQGPPTSAIVVNPNNSLPFSWSLTAVIDKNGNRNDFYYTQDNNQIYLSQCFYSGRTITFELEDREDRFINCRAGFPIKTAKRLKSITTKVGNDIVAIYSLSYNANEAHASLLSRIQQYGPDNVSNLPPTVFTYRTPQTTWSFGPEITWQAGEGPATLVRYTSNLVPIQEYKKINGICDINGDGLIDHIIGNNIWLNQGDGFVIGQNFYSEDLLEGCSIQSANKERMDNFTGIDYIDINGDGFPDRLQKKDGEDFFRIWLNHGNGLLPEINWSVPGDLKSLGKSWTEYSFTSGHINLDNIKQHGETDLIDINGDNLPDRVRKNQNENEYKVWLNLGNAFGPEQIWPGRERGLSYVFINDAGIKAHQEIDMVDINGDGLPDHVIKHRDNNKYLVSLNLGDRFGLWEEWLTAGDGYDLRYTYTDSVNYPTYSFSIGIGPIGWGFLNSRTEQFSHKEVDFFDINGDGLPDHVQKHRELNKFYVSFNQGDNFGPFMEVGSDGDVLDLGYTYYLDIDSLLTLYEEVKMIDMNGDGMPDHVQKDKDESIFKIRLNNRMRGDLLETIDNGYGGVINITYDTYIQKDANLPFSVNVVKSISTNDGLGNIVVSTYTYSDGLYNRGQKEFLGFAQVTKTDAEGNYTTTKFFQNETYDSPDVFPYKGKVKEELTYDKNNVLLVDTTFEYTCVHPQGKTNWYFPQLWQTRTTTNDGGVAKTTGNDFGYDGYGNVTTKLDLGDTTTGEDDVINVISYYQDTANYIVGLPLVQEVRDFNSVTKAKTTFEYYSTGNLKKKTQWLNTGPADPVIEMTYDDYGNVLTVKDARGNTTTTTYDETYHTYPITVTNAKGHVSSATYDSGTGNVLTETDANGQTTTYTYDVFGRPVTVLSPIDTAPSTVYNYYDTEFPRKVLYRTKQKGGATGDTSTLNYIRVYQFYDGLGRTAQTRTETVTVSSWGNWIISDCKQYNSRGLVSKSYDSYFPTATPPYTTFTYDGLGRVIRQDNPDGSYTTSAFSGWTQTKKDGNGHITDYQKDAFGRIVKVTEHNNGQLYETNYTYDTLGNLIKIVNAIGETTTIIYDSLGRKTAMGDPKMGNWEYKYDANGNLIWQKDGKSQTTDLEYDSLNRITKKTYVDQNQTLSITYEYDTAGEQYSKGRLIKVTDTSGYTKFSYDALGRTIQTDKNVIAKNTNKTFITQSGYNASSQQTKLTYPNSAQAKSNYDAGGNLLTVYDTTIAFAGMMLYDHHKQLLRIDYGNGLSTGYKYNLATSRLVKLISGTTGTPVPPPPGEEDPSTPPPPEDDPIIDPPPPDDGYEPPSPGDPIGSPPPGEGPGGGGPGMSWPDPTFIFPNKTKDFKAFDEFMEMLKRGEVKP